MADWIAPFILTQGHNDGFKYQVIHSLIAMGIYNLVSNTTMKDLVETLSDVYKSLTRKHKVYKQEVILKSSFNWISETILSKEFIAVLYKLNKYDTGSMVEMKSESIVDVGPALYFPVNTEKYKLDDEFNVTCSLKNKTQTCNNRYDRSYVEYTICVETTDPEKSIKNWIKKCCKEYDDALENDLNENLFVFFTDKKSMSASVTRSICGNGSQDESDSLEFELDVGFSEYKIPSPSKTRDTVFFHEKEDLFKDLLRFLQGKERYSAVGLPWQYGIGLFGKSGNGKTSTIKAILNFCAQYEKNRRHIVLIDLDRITNVTQLRSIFFADSLNGRRIPQNQRLYVFEDIDTYDTFISRTREKPQDTNDFKNGDKRCTLGDLLNIFDGIVETPGRLMIFTSNYPERLDSALLRPGRIDFRVDFCGATRKDAINIHQTFFGKTAEQDKLEDLPDYSMSSAEIVRCCRTSSSSHCAIHSILRNSKTDTRV